MTLTQLPIILMYSIFFLHRPISTLAGNFLTPHTHFLSDYNNLSDSPHISTSPVPESRKLGLGFGLQYTIANMMIIVITILNVLVYKLRELQEQNSGDKLSVSSSSLPSEQLCRRFLLAEILSATNNFDDSLVIGKGGFGKVYKGIIDNGACTVAIKRLNPLSKQGAPEFWTEINMLSKFRHSHLVSLIGYCDNYNEMILVYEYMVRGSLADHLHKICNNNGNSLPLSWVQRLKICIGAARGLDYLHTGTAILERVIHRDVKSSNILLDENWAAKISDFGLSRIGPADQEYTHVSTKHIKGTFGYMDPDYFLTRRLTRKSDVYAFGVVLLEVLCERPALDRSLDEDQWGLAGWGQQCIKEGAIHQIIGPNLKWEILSTSLMEFVQIADQCLHNRPKKRPTMSEVVARLELALALQLRTNLVIEEDLFDTCWPFDNQENADSYPEGDQIDKIVQLGDSSSRQFFPGGDPVVLVHSDAKPSSNAKSNNNSGHNSTLPNKGGVVQDVPTSGQIVTPNLKIFTFAELKSATRNFQLEVLGEGGFGVVFKGWVDQKTYSPSKVGVGKAVAIKRLRRDSMQGHAEGLKEVEILGKFSHPNLVKLLGYYCGGDKEFLLVYEYMQNGSLDRHIFGKGAKPLPWGTRLKIAIGAARGLSLLHATENQIIHRDIKTSNILLDGDFNTKLSGFGLAKSCPENGDTHISTRVMGTYGYAAPEYIATGNLRPTSDIFCFGVVLLEILTGLRVIDKSRHKKEKLVYWAMPLLPHKEKLKTVVDPRLEHEYPPEGALQLASLILKCLETNPRKRPSMKEVLETLEQINAIKMKPKDNSKVEARDPTVQRDVKAYKFLFSWTRNLGRSN